VLNIKTNKWNDKIALTQEKKGSLVDTKKLILVKFLAQLDVAFANKIISHQLSGNVSQTVCEKLHVLRLAFL
jgi:hypothetical protein